MLHFPAFIGVLDQHLEGRKYMVGDDWSLADYSVGAFEPFVNTGALPFDLKDYKHVHAFYERMAENPYWHGTGVPLDKIGQVA